MTNIPTDAEYLESLKVPITDEKLAELDSWYSKCSSNSLKFCDADYLAIRERLRLAEAERDAALAENAALWHVAHAFNAFQKHPLIPRWDDDDMFQAPGSLWALVKLGRDALAALPPRKETT